MNLALESCIFMWRRHPRPCCVIDTFIGNSCAFRKVVTSYPPKSLIWTLTIADSEYYSSSSFLVLSSFLSDGRLTTKCPSDYQYRTDYSLEPINKMYRGKTTKGYPISITDQRWSAIDVRYMLHVLKTIASDSARRLMRGATCVEKSKDKKRTGKLTQAFHKINLLSDLLSAWQAVFNKRYLREWSG